MTAPSNANTSGLVEKPEHMSDALFEVWRKIKPGPDYAPYRIEAAEDAAASAERRATAAEARADRLAQGITSAKLILTPEPGDKLLTEREKTARKFLAALQQEG